MKSHFFVLLTAVVAGLCACQKETTPTNFLQAIPLKEEVLPFGSTYRTFYTATHQDNYRCIRVRIDSRKDSVYVEVIQ
jgi:hypothetical protein